MQILLRLEAEGESDLRITSDAVIESLRRLLRNEYIHSPE